MSTRHLPFLARQVAEEQGWNDENVVVHLIGFIRSLGKDMEFLLSAYFETVAEEENEEYRQSQFEERGE